LKIKQFFLIFVYFLLLLIRTQSLFAEDNSWDKLPNIVIITLLGVRNSESIEDPAHQYIPNLWNKMFKEGTLYTNLINLNLTFHMPPVQAINTGKDYPVYWGISVPSIFQYVGEKYNMPASKLWSIGHFFSDNCKYYKPDNINPDNSYPCEINLASKIPSVLRNILSRQELIFLKFYGELLKKEITLYPIWDSVSLIWYQFFKKVLKEFKPKLIHYIMEDTETAHYCTFGRYVLDLRSMDREIFEIWQMIKEDPYYKNNTYLIITVDHGRDAYYMEHSDDDISNVWMYIYGPDIKKGIVIERIVHHKDIFATVAYLMKVETHNNKGKILSDAFLGK